MSSTKRTLGLDLGYQSIGYAVLDLPTAQEQDGAVIDAELRLFEPGKNKSGGL
jgi:RNase H-fold protein (predicted Holliday junction resolvase)